MLSVPELKIDLIDIAEESRNNWKIMAETLFSVANGGGIGNKLFEESCNKLLTAALDKNITDLDELIINGIDVRACTYQWLESNEFLTAHPVNSNTLKQIHKIKPKLGFLPLNNLIQLYFKKFEKCGDIKALIKFLHSELGKIKNNDLMGYLERLNRHKDKVINLDGYKKIALLADKENRMLADIMHGMGIEAADEGRFIELTNGYHYLNKLKKLAPEDDASILSEVIQPKVTEIAYEGKLLGQYIIETLSNNSIARNIQLPDKWLQSILVIAGDPRIPKTSSQYLKWWADISPKTRSLVYESLSSFDLKLFLEALDDFANKSHDEDLKRMFPKRRLFLEGLLEQKLIRGARLFVSNHADSYLRRNYNKDELPNYARVYDPNTSIIYLKLDKAHIVEGSHNHRFWIYVDIAEDEPPFNYDREQFYRSELSQMRSSRHPWYISHNGFWQGKIIESLHDMNIRVDPELVLDNEDYSEYRRRYGIRR